MADAYTGYDAGTTVTWRASGGSKVLTLTSLANDAARQGDKSASWVDATKGMPAFLAIRINAAVQAAPTSGKQFEVYIGESDSATAGTNNPGNLTGADGSLSNPDELKLQLRFAGALILSNARGTNIQTQQLQFVPKLPYSIPVVVNKSGQTGSATATDFQVDVTPYYLRTRY